MKNDNKNVISKQMNIEEVKKFFKIATAFNLIVLANLFTIIMFSGCQQVKDNVSDISIENGVITKDEGINIYNDKLKEYGKFIGISDKILVEKRGLGDVGARDENQKIISRIYKDTLWDKEVFSEFILDDKNNVSNIQINLSSKGDDSFTEEELKDNFKKEFGEYTNEKTDIENNIVKTEWIQVDIVYSIVKTNTDMSIIIMPSSSFVTE